MDSITAAPPRPDFAAALVPAVYGPDATPTIDRARFADDGSHVPQSDGPDDALPLADAIRRDADAYRTRGSALGLLYAEALSRLAVVAESVDATRPGDVFDRADVMDDHRDRDMLAAAYNRGYSAGMVDADREPFCRD